jgi:hypothetical protein
MRRVYSIKLSIHFLWQERERGGGRSPINLYRGEISPIDHPVESCLHKNTLYAGLGYSDLTLTYLAFYNLCRAGLFSPNPYISSVLQFMQGWVIQT